MLNDLSLSIDYIVKVLTYAYQNIKTLIALIRIKFTLMAKKDYVFEFVIILNVNFIRQRDSRFEEVMVITFSRKHCHSLFVYIIIKFFFETR